MSNHFLKRNPDNEPVCSCGYRPEVLDGPAPVGQQWKAKAAVLDHAKAMTDTTTEPQRSSDAPFRLPERVKFPRAGVRRTEDGRWLLSCWDADRIVHVIDEPIFDDRVTAFDYGYLTIGACRESGTNLNGWANA
ncbi:hypothetical protein [Arthrobacter sp. PsM3]|uniref:hypothetical protein n=1 Tax=Arthrobacter sp. PsM3 TaxID=3030531 RepID=UPI00263B647C|nr:hypothetical protein [Arthrobacter sp. PsM3]MDN4645380.1 hypothetical protein [Arthrobacter sp. PsM3]